MRLVSMVGLLSSLAAAAPVAALDVTVCGTTIPAHEVGVLQADLNCPAGTGTGPHDAAVVLRRGSTLELNGHSIAAPGTIAVHGAPDAAAGGKFAVQGPGSITGSDFAVFTDAKGSISVEDLTITGNRFDGVFAAGDVSAERVVLSGSTEGAGIWASGRVRGEDVTASSNAHVGVRAGKSLRIERLTATGNGGPGVAVASTGLTATLRDSTLTGNGTAAPAPIDIITPKRPRVKDTTCDHSSNGTGDPWGVCTGD